MDRILITGVAGFLGSNLAIKLLENNQNIICGIDDFSSSTMSNLYPILRNERFDFIESNLKNALNQKYDTIYHFAGDGSLKSYYANKYEYIINQIELIKLLVAHCIETGSKLILTLPYGDFSNHNKEKFEFFNMNNLIFDLISYATNSNKLNAKILRIDEVYGKNMLLTDERFIPSIISKSIKNSEIILESNNSHYFTYIDDVVNNLIKLNDIYIEEIIIDSISNELYLQSDIAKLIITYLKSNSKLKINCIEQCSPKYCPNIKNDNFKCQTPILKGISQTIDYFKLIYMN